MRACNVLISHLSSNTVYVRTSSFLGSAPRDFPIMFPPLKAMKVGICPQPRFRSRFERIPYFSTNSRNLNLLSDVACLVHIDFVERDIWAVKLDGEFLKDGSNDSARTTPLCPEINHSVLISADLRRKLRLISLTVRTDAIWPHDLFELLEGRDWGNYSHCGVGRGEICG